MSRPRNAAIGANENALREAIAHLRSTMAPPKVEIADRLAHIEKQYVTTGRDDQLRGNIEELTFNAASAGENGDDPSKRRALFVVGKSGSGKSTAILKAISLFKEFAPYRDDGGHLIYPMISIDAPGSLTLKILATDLLKAIGYPVVGTLGEGEAYNLLKEQLIFRKVLFLHIDEMQHVLSSNNHSKIEHLSNTVKSLLQIPNWPLHIIFSGVPQLAPFRENDTQIRTRSMLMEFSPMTVGDTNMLKNIVRRIVEVDAKMTLSEGVISDDFIARLLHATEGAFGTCIQITRSAIARSLRLSLQKETPSSQIIDKNDFKEVYATYTACAPDQNIFTAKNWMTINPANALARMQEEFAKKGKKKAKTEKP